ncbi:hypothetical protein SSAG_06438 [Streptomyces sp. Mg1]|nr:hypothetical protein SSAG_06438 [Streptomyces sp. Mg1]
MGALAAGVDEGALEVDAGDLALLGELGEQPGAAGQLGQVVGDGGGDEGGWCRARGGSVRLAGRPRRCRR